MSASTTEALQACLQEGAATMGLELPALYLLLADVDVAMAGGAGWLLAAGLLVGIGTRIGSGCTSGHGVCGMANLSRRSIVATLLFMGTAMATVYVVRHVLAG